MAAGQKGGARSHDEVRQPHLSALLVHWQHDRWATGRNGKTAGAWESRALSLKPVLNQPALRS